MNLSFCSRRRCWLEYVVDGRLSQQLRKTVHTSEGGRVLKYSTRNIRRVKTPGAKRRCFSFPASSQLHILLKTMPQPDSRHHVLVTEVLGLRPGHAEVDEAMRSGRPAPWPGVHCEPPPRKDVVFDSCTGLPSST